MDTSRDMRVQLVHRLIRLDQAAVLRLSGSRNDAMSAVMKAATRAGDGELWAALGIILSIFTDNGLLLFGQLLVAFALELTAYAVVKKLASRPRPFAALPGVVRLIAPPDEFSFPSGHTAGAFVMLSVVGHALSVLAVPLALLACLVGLSRVYLGVHYPSDVLAGAALGSASGILSIVFC